MFRDDHNRHSRELLRLLEDSGGTEPDVMRDRKRYPMAGAAALPAASDTARVLEVMRNNERLISAEYREALRAPSFYQQPDALQVVIRNNYRDERQHLLYLDSTLEKLAVAAPQPDYFP
jgi:hypothetical protein